MKFLSSTDITIIPLYTRSSSGSLALVKGPIPNGEPTTTDAYEFEAVRSIASLLAIDSPDLVLATWDRELAASGRAAGVDSAGIRPE